MCYQLEMYINRKHVIDIHVYTDTRMNNILSALPKQIEGRMF